MNSLCNILTSAFRITTRLLVEASRVFHLIAGRFEEARVDSINYLRRVRKLFLGLIPCIGDGGLYEEQPLRRTVAAARGIISASCR